MSAATPWDLELARLSPEIVEEAVSSVQGRMLAATMGHDEPRLESGAAVPALAHWLHCRPIVAHDDLDDNGHPKRGKHLPQLPYSKRMFAGSDIRFIAPIRIGETVQRKACVTEIAPKEGRSGNFFLVNVRQEFSSSEGPLLVEDQKIVYREAVSRPPQASGAGQTPEETPAWWRAYRPDERMLFRYSALLFSAHRIHFDRDFAVSEGYPALVVHGQLAATCLVRLVEANTDRQIETFSYRSTRPLFEKRLLTVCGRPEENGAALWVVNDEGKRCMQARARFRTTRTAATTHDRLPPLR